jgi:hypothetical protein
MKYIKIFENVVEKTSRLDTLKKRISELRSEMVSTESYKNCEHLMFDVFDITHTVEPFIYISFTENDGDSSINLTPEIYVDRDVAPTDRMFLKLAKSEVKKLQVRYNMREDDGMFGSLPKLNGEQVADILDRVAMVNEMGGKVTVDIQSFYSKPRHSSQMRSSKRITLESDSPDYKKWRDFIYGMSLQRRPQIFIEKIMFTFDVDIKMEVEDYKLSVPKSVIADFEQFCEDEKLGIDSRRRLAQIFSKVNSFFTKQ